MTEINQQNSGRMRLRYQNGSAERKKEKGPREKQGKGKPYVGAPFFILDGFKGENCNE